MIIQRELVIHNGCQHKDIAVKFNQGRTYAVTGKNACGKTNMLQLNIYGLLGIVSKSWGSQKDLNRNGTKDGFVEVHLFDTDSGRDIYVRRSFTAGAKNPDKLWYMNTNHDPDIMGRDAVDQVLESLYGVPMKILFELLWMRQGLSTWLLTASATSVYTFLNSIFDTSKFKKIRDVLMDAANSIALYEVDTARIQYLTDTINALQLKTYEDVTLYENELKTLKEMLISINANGIRISDKNARLAKLEAELALNKSRITEIQTKIDSVGSDPAPWLEDEHRRFIDAMYEIEQNLAKCKSSRDNYLMNVQSSLSEVNRFEHGLNFLKTDIDGLEKELDVYCSGDSCAFCGGSIHDHNKYRDNVSGAVIGTRKQRLEHDIEKHQNELKTAKKTHDANMSEVTRLTQQIETFENYLSTSMESRTTIMNAIKAHDEWANQKAAVSGWLEHMRATKVMIDDITRRIQEVEAIPAVDESVSHEITRIQARIHECEQIISRINSQKIADTTMLKSCTTELESRQLAQQKNDVSQKMFNRLMRLREGTSNKRIPARYLADKVEMLNKELEAYCKMSSLNIIMFLDPEDFVFRFTDGDNVRAAGQLSGAQQTLCATILQLALVRVVSPQLGVIQMDEPTVFLDPVNRSKLLSLFESLSSVLSTTGTITLVPTHDIDLIGSCSDVITLGRG